jgi:hypothetical protein
VGIPNQPTNLDARHAHAFVSPTVSISGATNNPVNLNNLTFDYENLYSASAGGVGVGGIVAKRDGVYKVFASNTAQSSGAASQALTTRIMKNGTLFTQGNPSYSTAASQSRASSAEDTIPLSRGDTLTLQVYSDVADTLIQSYMTVERLQ